MKKAALIFFLLIAAWLGGFGCFARQMNNYQIDLSKHTGAVIALTGGRNRIAEAVKIYNSGLAEHLFISGVSRNNTLAAIKNFQHLQIADESGVTLGHRARDTIGNAKETIAWLNKNHIDSIRLVTSNYHVARSIVEFKALAPDLKIVPHPVYSERIEKRWWKSWSTFAFIFAEYNKFLLAYCRYRFLNWRT